MYLAHLFRLKIFTPLGVIRLLLHVMRHGIQLSNVIHMCSERHVIALQCGNSKVTYHELFKQVASVSGYIKDKWNVKQGSVVLVMVDNSIPSVVLLFALSSLGCNIKIMQPIKDYRQFEKKVKLVDYDFIFTATEVKNEYYDQPQIKFLTPSWDKAICHRPYKPFVSARTNLSIFTSGSTGNPKKAERSNSLLQYLRAISDLTKTLHLYSYNTVFLPVPIYHSYGLSALFLGLMMNKRMFLCNKFDPAQAAAEISSNQIEVAILVPQMLHRLSGEDIHGLRCIISSGDVLPVSVLEKARAKFGDNIFNLYGTSETGLATIATPQILRAYPTTIGRAIDGCVLALVKQNDNNILHVKSGFAITKGYISTGDIVSQDEFGNYYIHGRADDLIVVNGINIYPSELLEIAYKHEAVHHVSVKAFTNEFGFRKIKLILVTKPGKSLDEETFKKWWASSYGTTLLPAMVEFKTGDNHVKLMDT